MLLCSLQYLTQKVISGTVKKPTQIKTATEAGTYLRRFIFERIWDSSRKGTVVGLVWPFLSHKIIINPTQTNMNINKKKQVTRTQVLGVVLLVVTMGWISSRTGGESETVVKIDGEPTGSQAHIISQNFVKEVLKAPSTAKFSSYDYSHIKNDEDTHTVASHVDSDNSFGASVRSNWTVTATYNGGDWALQRNWTLERLILDGEVVYMSDSLAESVNDKENELVE